MAIAFVKNVIGADLTLAVNQGTSFGTFASNVTAGNLIIVSVGMNIGTAGTVVSVTDTQSNTYTLIGGTFNSTNCRTDMYYAKNITGGTNIVKVVGSTTSANHMNFFAHEYSGADTTAPLDKSATGTGQTGAVSTLGTSGTTATTTTSNELLFCAINLLANANGTVGSGWTNRGTAAFTTSVIFGEDLLVSSTGAYAGTFSSAGVVNYAAMIATFAQAAGGAAQGRRLNR